MTKGLVSIVVIALNEGKRLPDLFVSIESQTYKDIEVIINDDPRTTDNTAEIIKEWQTKLKIVHLFKNDKPGKLGHARLEGSKAAQGEFLMHIDADMRLTPELVEDCVRIISEGADGVYINEEVIGEGFWTRTKWLEKRCYFFDEDVCSPRFFRTQSYMEVGGHNPELAFSEDLDIKLKFVENSKKLLWTNKIMFHNEGRLKPLKTLRNKFFWSQTATNFMKLHPSASIKQGNVFLRPAYIRNWKFLARHPFLTIGMYIMKTCEVIGAVSGLIYTKVFKKEIAYKTVAKK